MPPKAILHGSARSVHRVPSCEMQLINCRPNCFAFLTFEDPTSVNAAIVQEYLLNGNRGLLIFHSPVSGAKHVQIDPGCAYLTRMPACNEAPHRWPGKQYCIWVNAQVFFSIRQSHQPHRAMLERNRA
ncbi:hypothetical protein BD779DRAFT_178908 [Infundibulicybe gibba]|nr:hypothetical protein BD779DRAFT_178908 [Infundibulicybe gibba]